jgi:hypothetical protein
MKLRPEKDRATVFELKPERSLLDPNFHGYKLSLENLPIYTTSLKSGKLINDKWSLK